MEPRSTNRIHGLRIIGDCSFHILPSFPIVYSLLGDRHLRFGHSLRCTVSFNVHPHNHRLSSEFMKLLNIRKINILNFTYESHLFSLVTHHPLSSYNAANILFYTYDLCRSYGFVCTRLSCRLGKCTYRLARASRNMKDRGRRMVGKSIS